MTIRGLNRITLDPEIMGGKPCIRGMRVTVGTVVGLVASGHSTRDILEAYPYLEEDDIKEALTYAAWRVEEIEVPLQMDILAIPIDALIETCHADPEIGMHVYKLAAQLFADRYNSTLTHLATIAERELRDPERNWLTPH